MTEQEMIYTYRSEHLGRIRDLIYEKNKRMLSALTYNLFNTMKAGAVYERDDFSSDSYMAFIKCLNCYDLRQNKYTFAQALAVINKSSLMRESKHAMGLCNYENEYENAANSIGDGGTETVNEKIDQEIKWEQFNKFLKECDIKTQRNIEMMIKGYSAKAISRALHIRLPKVYYIYYSVCRKFAARYQEEYQ